MAKPRNKANQGLPLRWREINGVYYYRVPPGLEHARALLAHVDIRTTDRIYRRKAERVSTRK